MATWGEGNFDNDLSQAYLEDLIKELVFTIRRYLDDEDGPGLFNPLREGDAKVMPSVDLVILLCEHYEVSPYLMEADVSEWQTAYLEQYDLFIDSARPSAEYKKKRREVIVATFERLMAVVRKYD
jgi:hypothetical protein